MSAALCAYVAHARACCQLMLVAADYLPLLSCHFHAARYAIDVCRADALPRFFFT